MNLYQKISSLKINEKIKRFIKEGSQYLIRRLKSTKLYKELHTLNERLKQVNILDLPEEESKNPYQAIQEWLIDSFVEGLPFILFLVLVLGSKETILSFFLKWFGFGQMVEIIKKIVKIIKK